VPRIRKFSPTKKSTVFHPFSDGGACGSDGDKVSCLLLRRRVGRRRVWRKTKPMCDGFSATGAADGMEVVDWIGYWIYQYLIREI